MGEFDLSKSYNKNKKYHFIDMCEEILDEILNDENVNSNLVPDEETIRDKFKHDDGSGIINKLNDLLHFNIEAIADENDEEFFDMLKLLKYLFNLEKRAKMHCFIKESANKDAETVDVKKEVVEENEKKNKIVPIIEILAKPHMENIPTDISPKTVYGDDFLSIYKKIVKAKPSLLETHDRLYEVNEKFEYLTNRVFDYVLSDRAILYHDSALLELERIEKCLNDTVLAQLNHLVPSSIQGRGVFKTFFIIFICHCFISHDIDRIQINKNNLNEKLFTDLYIEQFNRYKDVEFEFDIEKTLEEDENNIINQMLENLSSNKKEPQVEMLFNLISYNVQITDKDFKNYKYALKKFPIIAQWLNKSINLNKNKKIKAQYIITIVQEIFDVVCNNPKAEGYNIVNDYYKYKNKNQTLLSALRKPEKANAIIVEDWVKRLENRLVLNLGGRELIIKKRKIDNVIYKIKKFIFSFRNIEDIEFVADFLYNTIFLLFLNMEDSIKFGYDLCNRILSKSQQRGRNIYITDLDAKNILAFYKDLYLYKGTLNENLAEAIVNKIENNLEANTDIFDIHMDIECDFNDRTYSSILYCQYDKKRNSLLFKDYRRMRDEKYIERAKKSGLENFLKFS